MTDEAIPTERGETIRLLRQMKEYWQLRRDNPPDQATNFVVRSPEEEARLRRMNRLCNVDAAAPTPSGAELVETIRLWHRFLVNARLYYGA